MAAPTTPPAASSARPCPARRTPACSPAAAATPTTSTSRACCTRTSCAATSPGRRSRTSTSARHARLPGVVAVLTGEDLNPRVAVSMYPSMFQGAEEFMSPMFPLSVDDVRFVGDPIALIVAESRYIAEDAAELVEIDYEPRRPDPHLRRRARGRRPHPPEPPEQRAHGDGGPAERRGSRGARRRHPQGVGELRAAPLRAVPMECRAVTARWEPFDQRLDVLAREPEPARGAPGVLARDRRAREQHPGADRRRRRRLRPEVVRRPRRDHHRDGRAHAERHDQVDRGPPRERIGARARRGGLAETLFDRASTMRRRRRTTCRATAADILHPDILSGTPLENAHGSV